LGPLILCKRVFAFVRLKASGERRPGFDAGVGMRIEIPDKKKLVYEMDLAIRWGDLDAMGHLNNTSYFRYFETIRIDWLNSIGQVPGPAKEGVVIVNAFCNFYRQIEYPGRVRLKLYASDPGRTTFETWVTMERSDLPGVVHAAGGATTMWVDFPKQKALELPVWLRELVTP
jgi:acyl-CoA thioester hydrolase